VDRGALYWLGLTLVCIIIQSFFSMHEMAIVSFNRVRLQYYVGQGKRRARWINSLLERPSRLFGTTLLGVNIAMQVGSECSREFYAAMNLDPDIAPITQLFLVLIFGELAPMFAARRYAERVSMFGIPILYLLSRLLTPVIWLIGVISRTANRLFGGSKGDRVDTLLSREELQHIVEIVELPSSDFNLLVDNLFSFRNKVAKQAMTPLPAIRMLPSDATIAQMRRVIARFDLPCLPIYYASRRNIVAIALPRDLIYAPDHQRVRDCAAPPWFITGDAPLMQILKQFRHNHRTVAVVLDASGQAIGLLSLDNILEEIFGKSTTLPQGRLMGVEGRRRVIDCTVVGNTPIEQLNEMYDIDLPTEEVETIAQLLTKRLGHPPEEGESVRIGPFELTALEVTLMGAKRVALHASL